MDQFSAWGEEVYGPSLGQQIASNILDVSIIKPLIESCCGYNLITKEKLTEFERKLNVVFALVDLITLGSGLSKFAKVAGKIGMKEAVSYFGKQIAVELSADVSVAAVAGIGNNEEWPAWLTLSLGLMTGITVGQIGNTIAFDEDEIGRIWREVRERGGEGKSVVDETIESGSNANTKPYTNSRPSFRKGVVEEVWENAKDPDGLVRDPNTGEVINWTPGESRKGVWDMGHIPEAKYSEMHEAYMNGELTTKEFLDWYNDPTNYRPELPSNNRSHKYE